MAVRMYVIHLRLGNRQYTTAVMYHEEVYKKYGYPYIMYTHR